MIEHHKILERVSEGIVSWEELYVLGNWLGCDPNDIRRRRNVNHGIKYAAYEILCSFYNSVPKEERWRILIEALRELQKNTTVKELRLEDYLLGWDEGRHFIFFQSKCNTFLFQS